MIIIVKPDNQSRLCNDGLWRSFAHLGTYPECVKEYKRKGNALRRAKEVKEVVVQIPYHQGYHLDMTGQLTQEKETGLGFTTTIHHNLLDLRTE